MYVCGMFGLWTRLTGSHSSADGSTLCVLLLDQHYFTTQTDSASLGLAGSISFYRISLGLGGRGRRAAVFWRPPVAADYSMTVRRRSSAPRPPRRVVRGPWTARWFRTSSAQKRRTRRRGNNARPPAFTVWTSGRASTNPSHYLRNSSLF